MAIKLGSVYGVPIFIDYSFLIIFALIVWSVGFVLMPASYPGLSQIEYLAIGFASAFLLFASILVHELAHSIVAKQNRLQIGRITLFLFGGVSEMQGQPDNPNIELKMAAAGPLTSIAIAAGSGGLWLLSSFLKAPALVQAPLNYTFLVNVIVAGFNLIPAFPMDGGRILRAVLWRSNRDIIRATKTAATVGRIFAYVIMFVGIFFVLAIDFFTGIWLLLIGWFISSGATSELSQTLIQRDLAGLKARSMMTRDLDTVTPEITLSELSAKFMEHKHNGFPVVDSSGDLVGCVTMEDLRKVRKERWDSTRVADIMIPKEKLITVRESEQAMKALQLMNANRIGRIFVLDDSTGKLSGIITRSDVVRTIRTEESLFAGRSESGIPVSQMIAVEQGMFFELEPPKEVGGADWSAVFNSTEFALISQKTLQLSDGSQSRQFTFQPLKKGRFVIALTQSPQPSTL